jgi:TRAP-type mannitol/chloroaromatic compound transport system permease small subunit
LDLIAREETYRERRRRAGTTLGLILLAAGFGVFLIYVTVAITLSLSVWGGTAQSLGSIVYPAGLLVLPGSFMLTNAGATLLLRRK